MALIITPEPNDSWEELIGNPGHQSNATRCGDFLESFKQRPIKPWEARCHGNEPYKYTCWYVSFKETDEFSFKCVHRPRRSNSEERPFILNFEIQSSAIYIDFRFWPYIPNDKLRKWTWSLPNYWKRIKFDDYSESQLVEIVGAYLNKIQTDFDNDTLRRH